ncbi:lysylphosphatidylglycerol synthase transmembrane domain-containing protein [Corynebacterium sp. H113]|uniref:lysylphosphatidylglycerol synthase transmembrane domain-containing protein n=1 Tax=Corynebacterium sp. H113 TaxID=3133419 RepID=UPI0030B1425E
MERTKRVVSHLARAGWVRWALTGIIVAIAAWLTLQNQGMVTDGLTTLRDADTGWTLIAIAAVLVSMFAMAEVMWLLFRAANVKVTRRATNALTFVANSWSVSVPGGVAFSTALQVRRQLKWGASPVIVSWYVLMSGALAFLGLVALAIGSVFFIGQRPAPGMLVMAGVAVLAATALLWWFSRNTILIERIAIGGLHLVNKVRRSPLDRDETAVRDTIRQLTSVQLGPTRMGLAFLWSLTNWLTDVICLYAAIRAVGIEGISMAAVLLAFVSGKVAGFIQATPGGVGPVEALLTGTLVAAGMTGVDAFAAVLLYRIVSFILVAIIGWIIYLIGYTGDKPTTGDTPCDASAPNKSGNLGS